MSYAIGGQGSGDFKETSARVQIFHVVTRNSLGLLTPDAFTQSNPPVVTGQVSTTLASISKVGVLGGTVAFTRPDYGNNFHGGAVKPGGSYSTGLKPLGIYINDALGNAYENTPGVASGRGPYLCGSGSCLGLSVYETKSQITPGTTITYQPGNLVYASVNGLLTNILADAYEQNASSGTATIMGVVKVAPDANSSLLVIDLRV